MCSDSDMRREREKIPYGSEKIPYKSEKIPYENLTLSLSPRLIVPVLISALGSAGHAQCLAEITYLTQTYPAEVRTMFSDQPQLKQQLETAIRFVSFVRCALGVCWSIIYISFSCFLSLIGILSCPNLKGRGRSLICSFFTFSLALNEVWTYSK